MGKIYFTSTGLPFCIPGFYLGMIEITRTASASNAVPIPFKTLIFFVYPSLVIIKVTYTTPIVFLFYLPPGVAKVSV
jgi:uncharacterized pyridoxamine 5'-phosphate oxidase family protein